MCDTQLTIRIINNSNTNISFIIETGGITHTWIMSN